MAIDYAIVAGASLSAALQVGVGIWVYSASPRSWVNRGFALFLLAQGLGDLVRSFVDGDALLAGSGVAAGWYGAGTVAYFAASFGVAVLAFTYPDGRTLTRWGTWVLGFLALVALAGIVAMLQVQWASSDFRESAQYYIGYTAAMALYSGQAIWALRLLPFATRGDERQRRSASLLVSGIVIYPVYAFDFLVQSVEAPLEPIAWSAAAWTSTIIRNIGFLAGVVALGYLAWPRQSRGVQWAPIVVGVIAVGLGSLNAWAAVTQRSALAFLALYATSYLLVLIVAYAILRRDVFTIDVKVRWGISKTTVAAVFIGVFFVVSELAQQFFGERFQSEYLGIAAAGLLVVAIAPLQRLADRLAAKAVPETASMVSEGPVATYREQVQLAWSDGKLTPKERKMLRALRHRLDLDLATADRVDDEAGGP